MLSTIITSEHKRKPTATCLKCKKLYTACNSWVRAGILSEKIVVCDYAREGCTKYVGPGQYAYNNQKIAVQEALRKGELLSIQRLQNELGLGKQVIMSNVHRLRKQGFKIRTEQVNGEIHYQLNNKVS